MPVRLSATGGGLGNLRRSDRQGLQTDEAIVRHPQWCAIHFKIKATAQQFLKDDLEL